MTDIKTNVVLQLGEVIEADDWIAWYEADINTITITFRKEVFWDSLDVEELNDTVDQYAFPAALVDLRYNIDVERTAEAWMNGEDGDSIWIACTCDIDWSEYGQGSGPAW